MSAGGAKPAGSGRIARLDPLALPVRFRAADALADENVRLVDLYSDQVILRRKVNGLRMTVSVPVSAFLGVAIRLVPPQGAAPGRVAVILEHRDPAISVPLFAATDSADVLAEWRLWARIFAKPLLVVDDDGNLYEPFARLGGVQIADPCERARGRATLGKRRPRIMMRRKPGRPRAAVIHREREIIAPN